MKNKFQETLNQIENKRVETIQKLITLSYYKLDELKKYYYDWYKGAEESGYTESTQVNYLKHSFICEAIEIKRGNDEVTLDCLT